MFPIKVWLTDKDVAEVRSRLGEAGRQSGRKLGCPGLDDFHSQNDDQTFLHYERWEDEEAFTPIYQQRSSRGFSENRTFANM